MTTPYYADESVTLHLGDCRAVLADMEPCSVDAVVTDPPYDLTSGSGGGFMGQTWDSTGVAFDPDTWCAVLRVLKPGGHLVAFGAPRTYHRLACAIEDAGFEIRDSLHWINGGGFPKSLNVSAAIDKAAGAEREVIANGTPYGRGSMRNRSRVEIGYRPTEINPDGGTALITAPATDAAQQWEGWGTALKPAHEPIILARKPLDGTVAANIIEHGTGALNINDCRVPGEHVRTTRKTALGLMNDDSWRPKPAVFESHDAGRWPPNVLLGEESAAEMDRQTGILTSGANPSRRSSDKFRDAYGEFPGQEQCTVHRGADSGGASRFFPVFRYEAKADASERPRLPDGTSHPTVKPVSLIRWLVRLITPPGGLVLDLFAGSGTTGEACVIEGFPCVLIEREPQYAELIKVRLAKPIQPDLFGGAA